MAVPEGVVHLAEPVDVQHDESRRAAADPALGEDLVDALLEQDAVRETGEPVVEGLVLVAARLLAQPAGGGRDRTEQPGHSTTRPSASRPTARMVSARMVACTGSYGR